MSDDDNNVFNLSSPEDIVIVKLINGDLIVAKNHGYDDDNSLLLQDPLVVTATSGYMLLTDYVPFVTNGEASPIIQFNPATPVYMESVGPKIVDYYRTCLRYRDMIKVDMDSILDKSHQLIRQTMADMEAERAATGQQLDVQMLSDLLNTPISSMINDDEVKARNHDQKLTPAADQNEPKRESPKIVDFAQILGEAMKKKKDPLN